MTHKIRVQWWQAGAFLIGIYLLASLLSFVSERAIFARLEVEDRPTKITQSHFRQPDEWALSPGSFSRFLDSVTQHRPGLLASKWLYSGVFAMYLLLASVIFFCLTQYRQEESRVTHSTQETLEKLSGIRHAVNIWAEDAVLDWSFLRKLAIWGLDFFIIFITLPLAYTLRFNLSSEFLDIYWTPFLYSFFVLVGVRIVLWYVFRLQRMVWRYTDLVELRRLFIAATVGTLLAVSISAFLTRLAGFPRSVFILEWGIYLFLTAGTRICVRMWREAGLERQGGRSALQARKPVIVVGAGTGGSTLVREISQHPSWGERVVAFADDDPQKRGREVVGVPVYTPIECLPELLERFETRQVYLALPSATSAQMRRIVRICEDAGAEFRTLPSLKDIFDGSAILHQLRPVRLEDLLGREPVSIDTDRISGWLQGKRVLVTGAAGSIGSELCRQLLQFGMSHLTLLDQSELQLYLLQEELAQTLAKVPHRCVIGSITDLAVVTEIFEAQRPQVVFHAAAYKHVHLMEDNPGAALVTNVLGTFRLGQAALQFGVERFVLISSDKAVHPTSVMGATKRLAEHVCLGLAESSPTTAFNVVRFGNVIGSSGSVVPLFERQLAAGGPLTVTHPEVTRFFMTIPEAVRLILQAVMVGQGGEIFLLDMGEPVRIRDLAEQIIRLAGREPYTDVPIQFVGLRPGEKLHEELWHADERMERTAHPKILRVDSSVMTIRPLEALLAEVETLRALPQDVLKTTILALANGTSDGLPDTPEHAPGVQAASLGQPAHVSATVGPIAQRK